MTKEELIRNLKYTIEKHKNDKVDTFGTNISLMCKDILDYLEQPTTKDCLGVEDCVSRQEERKVGKWILSRPGIYTCSICGLDVSAGEVNHQGYVFCPKCGNRVERK